MYYFKRSSRHSKKSNLTENVVPKFELQNVSGELKEVKNTSCITGSDKGANIKRSKVANLERQEV